MNGYENHLVVILWAMFTSASMFFFEARQNWGSHNATCSELATNGILEKHFDPVVLCDIKTWDNLLCMVNSGMDCQYVYGIIKVKCANMVHKKE